MSQSDKAQAFLALHQQKHPFILGNAWDGGSARLLAGLGYRAIGTSSWASANVYGKRDGGITRDEALAHARAIAEATDLPVSADLESGFGVTPENVGDTYREAANIGLVGATIEDARPSGGDEPLFDIHEATERVAAAAEATRGLGFPFQLTARAEGFLRGKTNLDDVILRLQAYEKAGADVLMAPGLPDVASVKEVCAAIDRPFNFMAGIPGISFSVSELEAAGVRRISLAMSLYYAAMGGLFVAARDVIENGKFTFVDDLPLPYGELLGHMRD